MKIPPLFAPAAQERDGFRVLPQHPAGFALSFDVFDDAGEINGNELFHKRLRGWTIALSKVKGQPVRGRFILPSFLVYKTRNLWRSCRVAARTSYPKIT